MQKLTSLPVLAALVASMCSLATAVVAAEPAAATVKVAGEKLDSGLGQLPHYSRWTDLSGKTLVGEKLDSGLGELPHYSQWTNATATTPMVKPAKPANRDGDQSVQLSRLK